MNFMFYPLGLCFLMFSSDWSALQEALYKCIDTIQSINQSAKIYIAPLQDTYSEALPTQANAIHTHTHTHTQ